MRFFPVDKYDHFRISLYRHDEKIVPWQVELPSQVNAKASFLKSIKLNSKEYKIFRDDKSWLPFRESTETTIMSHNLLTMILPPFETDPDTGEFETDDHWQNYLLYYGQQTDAQCHPDMPNQHAKRDDELILDFELILQFRSRLISLFL